MEFRYRFAPFGTKFHSHPDERPTDVKAPADHLHVNELVVDVGGVCWSSTGSNKGVLDHHFLLADTNRQPFPSAAAAILHQANLIKPAYEKSSIVWLVSHQQPDFDALCAMFLARRVVEGAIPADNWRLCGLEPDRWEPGREVIDWFNPDVTRRSPAALAGAAGCLCLCDRQLQTHPLPARARSALHSLCGAGAAGSRFCAEGRSPCVLSGSRRRHLASSKHGLNPLNDSVLENSPEFELEKKDARPRVWRVPPRPSPFPTRCGLSSAI